MKKYIFIITAIIISSCNNSKKENTNNKKVVKKELRPFFDSDEINHYYLNFSEEDFMKIMMKEKNTPKELEFIDLFVHHFPDTIPKENFEKILLNYNYKKSNLSLKQQKEIENVFSEKDSLQDAFAACAAEYRDIFIFKKKKETVGIVKMCFKCGRVQFVGNKIDTEGFGLWTELDKLRKIVRPENYSILINN
ncbi:hypothetical protein DMB65_07105 [Flavobacterium cheongpyeongense]|uniref:Lipoprotein n=1 Tax=Flavobacterium cheongpyeongense TaxID=2212651 RepID=A0A2V4BSU5_9FLAO|nr:hypothetical protein [Flavobacterium cheongpyeongense]PXY41707.1 hypothetical protein DMB65_07105 [Flavobacterium cheongpyeongense]